MLRQIAIAAVTACTSTVALAEDGVAFDVTLTKGGQVISNPRVVGYFDKTMSVEISRTMKFEALARQPDSSGVSYTHAKIWVLDGSNVSAVREISIAADLAKDTTVEYEMPGSDARVRIVQKRVKL